MSVARGSRRGANAIEFALCLPAFLGIVFGLMDYGRYFGLQAGLDNAVSMACREGAMVDPAVGDPVAVASADLDARSAMFCGSGCVLTVDDLGAPPSRTLVCSASRDLTSLTGWLPMPATVGSTSYYRFEWQRN